MARSASSLFGGPSRQMISDRLLQVGSRLDQSVGDELRQDVGHAHHQPEWATGRLSTKRLLELSAEREDLVSIGQGHLTDIGEDQAASGALKQLLPDGRLQIADLHAHGLRCQVKLGAGARQVALFGDGPKEPEMVEVECLHGPAPSFEIIEHFSRNNRFVLMFRRCYTGEAFG